MIGGAVFWIIVYFWLAGGQEGVLYIMPISDSEMETLSEFPPAIDIGKKNETTVSPELVAARTHIMAWIGPKSPTMWKGAEFHLHGKYLL